MGADVPDLFLITSQLGRADLTCSLQMMLVMEGARKEKKGLKSFFFEKSFRFVEIACSDYVRRLYSLCALLHFYTELGDYFAVTYQ